MPFDFRRALTANPEMRDDDGHKIQTTLLQNLPPKQYQSPYQHTLLPSTLMNHFNGTNRSGVVHATSVTAQFNALAADRDVFQKAQNAARVKHEAIQVKISELKKHRTTFSTQNRAEQEVLGTNSRMRDILLQKKARFTRVLENERKAIEACAKHSQSLQDAANQATLQFADEMAQVNDQVASTLHHEMREKQIALLSVELVEALILPRRPVHLHGALDEALQVLRHARSYLDEMNAQHAALTSNYKASQASRYPMDLFYGLTDRLESETVV